MAERAVVLVSGGLDSATTLAIARHQGHACYALTVDYGQRHRHELVAARHVAEALGAVRHVVLAVDLRAFGGSALTDDIDVPVNRETAEMALGIPITYVPARNTVLLALALGWAEVLGAPHIYIGVNALDYSGYPDCRPAFIEAFTRLAAIATKAGVEKRLDFQIHAPLVNWSKEEIIRHGLALGVNYSLTHSCYAPADDGAACGRCDACRLRLRGFDLVGIPDPARYVESFR